MSFVQKGEGHKHNFTIEKEKVVPVRKGSGGVVALDTIKLKQCSVGKCKETIAYDLERDIK